MLSVSLLTQQRPYYHYTICDQTNAPPDLAPPPPPTAFHETEQFYARHSHSTQIQRNDHLLRRKNQNTEIFEKIQKNKKQRIQNKMNSVFRPFETEIKKADYEEDEMITVCCSHDHSNCVCGHSSDSGVNSSNGKLSFVVLVVNTNLALITHRRNSEINPPYFGGA